MKALGLPPTSFAYPYGERNEELDLAMTKTFDILRSTAYTHETLEIKDLNPVFYSKERYKDKNLVFAVGIVMYIIIA